MTLSEEARERVADIVDLQPTKNAELQERWEMDSGSEVHGYLASELDEYYYRNEDSLICATPAAEQLVGDGDADGPRAVTGTRLERLVLDELPGPTEEPQSVVATLHDLRDADGVETDVDEVRSALHTLADKGLVERIERTVPTFRLAVDRERIEIDDS
jgi:hypothetical protein